MYIYKLDCGISTITIELTEISRTVRKVVSYLQKEMFLVVPRVSQFLEFLELNVFVLPYLIILKTEEGDSDVFS